MAVPNDRLGALVRHDRVTIPGAAEGPLAGTSFVAKDVFDVAGHRTGAGSPDWLRTHEPAAATAPSIEWLLAAGATLVGKAQTDELTYSLIGQNAHYGTPVNPAAPGRVPGGSSSGSAAAVAGGLADFALGTDCAGSVRMPASLCGILGFRPSHGRVPLAGIMPLAPSFDTVGWLARSAELLEAVGTVLLRAPAVPPVPASQLLIPVDLLADLPGAVASAFEGALPRVSAHAGTIARIALLRGLDLDGPALFRTIQGAEAWAAHGDWITGTAPAFGPGIGERFDLAARVRRSDADAARAARERFAGHLDGLLGTGAMICLPTAPEIAPRLDATPAELESFRAGALRLLCIAGLAGLPQVSLPLASRDGCPLGLSLIGRHGADLTLLALARRIMHRTDARPA
ncbi:MAG: amidase [Dongiaceae bacterium]